MNLGLTNKVILITGANGGIGRAISSVFLDEGAILLLGYRYACFKARLGRCFGSIRLH